MAALDCRLAIRLAGSPGEQRCELAFVEDGRELTAEFPFSSPVTADDREAARWLIEEHPRLIGSAADDIAARLGARLRALGGELRTALLDDSAGSGAAAIASALTEPGVAQRLEVRVDQQTPGWLPWELVQAPGAERALSCLAASFVRATGLELDATPHGAPAPAPAPARARALRVLVVVARPRRDDDVPFRSVASRIVRAACASGSALEVRLLRPPTFAALEGALEAAQQAGGGYDAVHFDGHGVYRQSVFTGGSRRGYLRFETEGGGEDVTGRAVGELLASYRVPMLLLNACRSGFSDDEGGPGGAAGGGGGGPVAPPLGSVATDVLAAGVPNVLAMGFNVYVSTAAALIGDVYAALASGSPLGEAVSAARRHALQAPPAVGGGWGWLVPISYEAPPPSADLAGAGGGGGGGGSQAGASTAVARSELRAGGGPPADRPSERLFVGYEEVIQRLDRLVPGHTPVEILGVAGAGKSAVAAEFVRWATATGLAGAAIALDLAQHPSFASFEQALEGRRAALPGAAPDGTPAVTLLVLDGVDAVTSEPPDAGAPGTAWPAGDRIALHEAIAGWGEHDGRVLLTARATSDIPGVTSLVLDGLDAAARRELALAVGFDLVVPAAAAVLEWTQGVPAVIEALPGLLERFPHDSVEATYEMLFRLCNGATDIEGLDDTLLRDVGLRAFPIEELRELALPIALSMFQGYLPVAHWETFCRMAELKRLPVTAEGASAALDQALAAAAPAGLAARADEHGYRLHPLAALATRTWFGSLVAALGGDDAANGRRSGDSSGQPSHRR